MKRSGLIANSLMFEAPETDRSPRIEAVNLTESVIRAVRLDTKHVTAARDRNGNPIGNDSVPEYDAADGLWIRRITNDEQTSEDSLYFVTHAKESDRLIAEMTPRERIELLFCMRHGILCIVSDTYFWAECLHGAPLKGFTDLLVFWNEPSGSAPPKPKRTWVLFSLKKIKWGEVHLVRTSVVNIITVFDSTL